MATNIAGTLNYDTKLDTSGFEKDSATMSVAIGNILADLSKMAVDGLKQLTQAGINYNAQMETYQTSFKVMLGDADKANKFLAELRDKASKTPFELSDLAEASKTMLAFGVDSKKTQKYLSQLGDVSQGNSQKLQSLALVLGQVSAQGKLTGQDFLQLVNAGFPIQQMATDAGMSMSEFKDAISEGKITIDDLTTTLDNATSEGGLFYGSMTEQSKTFNGQMSTLKDNFNTFLGSAFKPLFDFAKNNALPIINDLLTGGENIKKWLKDNETLITIIIGVLGTLITAILAYNIAMNATAIITAIVTASTTAFGAVMAFITSPITLVILAIGALITIGILLYKNWDTIKEYAWNIFNWIANFFKNIANSIGGYFSGMFDVGKNIVNGIWNGISGSLQWIKDKITGWVGNVLNFFKRLLGIASPSKVMANEVGKFIPQGLAVGITANTDSALNSIDTMNDEIMNKMKQAVNIETGKSSFSGISGSVSQILSSNATFDGNFVVEAKVDEGVLFEANERITSVKNLQTQFGK